MAGLRIIIRLGDDLDMSGKEKSLCYYVYARFTYEPESKIFLATFDYADEVAAFIEDFLALFSEHGALDNISKIIIEPAEIVEGDEK